MYLRFSYLNVYFLFVRKGKTLDKGKPLERVGRKATGLRPVSAGYGRRAPGRRPSLLQRDDAHGHTRKEGRAYAHLIHASPMLPPSLCHSVPRLSPPTHAGAGAASCSRPCGGVVCPPPGVGNRRAPAVNLGLHYCGAALYLPGASR